MNDVGQTLVRSSPKGAQRKQSRLYASAGRAEIRWPNKSFNLMPPIRTWLPGGAAVSSTRRQPATICFFRWFAGCRAPFASAPSRRDGAAGVCSVLRGRQALPTGGLRDGESSRSMNWSVGVNSGFQLLVLPRSYSDSRIAQPTYRNMDSRNLFRGNVPDWLPVV